MDYDELGFKCGIEIHQRLNTKKLFCECFCDPNKTIEPPIGKLKKITRKLRMVAGELGKLDPAAAYESAKGKNYIYLADEFSSCQVEADEEPPHKMNQTALGLGLVVSKLLDATILDEVFVMRKLVVDGSSVSGFQRTALIALNGVLQTTKGPLSIETIALEEESAGIIEKGNASGETIYRLDRLGIPLIELATSPDIRDGEHAKEAAEKIGQLLRSTGKVQRGLGTIRQDLNVSIARGARVELKGVQDLALIPILIENEVSRQINLLKLRERLKERHLLLGPEHFSLHDLTEIFSNTSCKLIKDALSRKEKVFGFKLQSFSGLFKEQIMPSFTFGKEVASYVRSYSGAKGIIHSDEDLEEKYSLNLSEITSIQSQLNVSENDLFILCVGDEVLCKKALEAAFNRCLKLQEGIPEETRRAEGEISVFMRPLPGSSRMYPETDISPIQITPDLLLLAQNSLPESQIDKKKKYLAWGLNEQIADKMIKSQDFERFERFAKENQASSQVIALTLLETIISLRRENILVEILTEDDLSAIFALFSQNKITKAAIPELIKAKCKHYSKPFPSLIDEFKLEKMSELELIPIIQSIDGAKEKKFAEIMKKYRLNVDAADLQKLLE